jgi:hypothetical protein
MVDWFLQYWVNGSNNGSDIYLLIYAILVGTCITLTIVRSVSFLKIAMRVSNSNSSLIRQGVAHPA